MGEPLTPEQVEEIRTLRRAVTPDDTVLALCDTVESLRADRAEVSAKVKTLAEGLLLCTDELETLRGIAKRSRNRWVPCRDTTGAYWQRSGAVFVTGHMVAEEPMTEAEMHAIYGTEESDG